MIATTFLLLSSFYAASAAPLHSSGEIFASFVSTSASKRDVIMDLATVQAEAARIKTRSQISPIGGNITPANLTARGNSGSSGGGYQSLGPKTAKIPLQWEPSTIGRKLRTQTTLQVGTRPQNVVVTLDTGSNDLWIPTTQCGTTCGSTFDDRRSSTLKPIESGLSQGYADESSFSGGLVRDAVSVGGLTAAQQGFGLAQTVTPKPGRTDPIYGILGLGFSEAGKMGGQAPNLIQQLQADGQLDQYLFSLAMGGNPELCVGCMNPARHMGVVQFYDLFVDPSDAAHLRWSVRSAGLIITTDRGTKSTGPIEALIDSGTDAISVTPDMAAQFYGQIPGAESLGDKSPGGWLYPCDSEIDQISLKVGGSVYSMSNDDLNWGRVSFGPTGNDCVGSVWGLETPAPAGQVQQVLIGTPWMKSVYTVFAYAAPDNNKPGLGFAQAINF